MKKIKYSISGLLLLGAASFAADVYISDNRSVPDIAMADKNLPFKRIEGYQNYRIIATHYRTDKNELRYILANPVAYNAMMQDQKTMPEGSKIVKIGWTVKKMEKYPAAMEADEIQRVEYMFKDSSKYDKNGDHWGYARFVKKGDEYISWKGNTQECIACHSVVSDTDYLFTRRQMTF